MNQGKCGFQIGGEVVKYILSRVLADGTGVVKRLALNLHGPGETRDASIAERLGGDKVLYLVELLILAWENRVRLDAAGLEVLLMIRLP